MNYHPGSITKERYQTMDKEEQDKGIRYLEAKLKGCKAFGGDGSSIQAKLLQLQSWKKRPLTGSCKTCGGETEPLKNGQGFRVLCEDCHKGNGQLFSAINNYKKAKYELKCFKDTHKDAFKLEEEINHIKHVIQDVSKQMEDLQDKKNKQTMLLKDMLGDLECGCYDQEEYEELQQQVKKTKLDIEQCMD